VPISSSLPLLQHLNYAYEGKKVPSVISLHAQAFGKVWNDGFVHKLQKMLPKQHTELLKSYITTGIFRVIEEES